MTEFMEAKIRNLNAINDWCKELMADEDEKDMLKVYDALLYDRHWVTVNVTSDGISVYDGCYARHVVPVDYDCPNLIKHETGEELIYQWQNVKPRIIEEYNKMKRQHRMMFNFTV